MNELKVNLPPMIYLMGMRDFLILSFYRLNILKSWIGSKPSMIRSTRMLSFMAKQ